MRISLPLALPCLRRSFKSGSSGENHSTGAAYAARRSMVIVWLMPVQMTPYSSASSS